MREFHTPIFSDKTGKISSTTSQEHNHFKCFQITHLEALITTSHNYFLARGIVRIKAILELILSQAPADTIPKQGPSSSDEEGVEVEVCPRH